jgi:DNA-binding response OmpR family regulator
MSTGKGRSILLVEDDARMLRLFNDALTARGYTVIGVKDPREVGSILSTYRPSLLLLDIMMPEIDGIELCKRARTMIGQKMPIIFLTALNDVDTIRKALAAGGNDYILKGGSLAAALDRIDSWLAKSRPADTQAQQAEALRVLKRLAAESEMLAK